MIYQTRLTNWNELWPIANILNEVCHGIDIGDIKKESRTAYWDQTSGTVIIRDPQRVDGGTAFRPIEGKKYYDKVLK